MLSEKLRNKLADIPVLIGSSIKGKNPAHFGGSFLKVLELMQNPEYEHVQKEERKIIPQSATDIRPTNDTPYMSWNGLTIIDLDIKNPESAKILKPLLHKMLTGKPWYLATVFSSSHSGLHIYTCCKPPTNVDEKMYQDHFEMMTLYVWRAMFYIYGTLLKTWKGDFHVLTDINPVNNTSSRKELRNGQLSESKVFDLAMMKLSQVALIPYEPEPLVNEFFNCEYPLPFNENEYQNLTEGQRIRDMFDNRRGRLQPTEEPEIHAIGVALPSIDDIVPRNYNNEARYRLAYTMCKLYDVTQEHSDLGKFMKSCFMKMCSGNPKYAAESKAFEAVFVSAVHRQQQGICPMIPWAVNELMTVHHFNIESNIQEIKQEQIENIDIDVELAKPVQIPPELHIPYTRVFSLDDNQYVSDGTYDIMQKLKDPNSKTLLVAEPGTGKTVFVTNLMQTTNLRILCVVPFISVIESKFKTLPPTCQCQFVYGFTGYDATGLRNAVMTFDKFSKMTVSDLDMCFDLIVLDECHLLQMSAYRALVPANTIDNLRATKTPVIIMTGTPIAEHMFLDCTDIVKFIRNRATDKLFNVIICNSPQEKFCHAVMHIANAIKDGRRVIVPTNEGNAFIEKVVSGVQELLDRMVTYFYYKKENNEQEFMQNVNYNQTIGETELLFCSSYLSVGVDINDMFKFDIVYLEDFTGHEIEQFNNRLRKVDLASYYFVSKFMGDGTFKENVISRKLPNLRMSRIRQLELSDLIALHTLKADDDGKVMQLYDFFTRHMNMPYIIKNVDGTCSLHTTCYALWTFEESWRKWSIQLPVLCEILKQYNYQISVINAELMESDKFDEILVSSRDGYRLYQDVIDDDVQFIASKLHDKDFFDVLVYTNGMKLVQMNGQQFEVDTEKSKIYIKVKNVPQCHRFMKSIRLLSKYYSRETILKIYNENSETLARLEQVFQTVELLDYASNDRLTTSNIEVMQYILTKMFEGKKFMQMSRKQRNIHIDRMARIYQEAYDLQSATTFEKLQKLAFNMFKRLVSQETQRKGDLTMNDYRMKSIPRFDSNTMQQLETHKYLMYTMFQANLFDTNETKISDEASIFFSSQKTKNTAEPVDLPQAFRNLRKYETGKRLAKSMVTNLMGYAKYRWPNIQETVLIGLIDGLAGVEGNLHKALENRVMEFMRN